MTADAQQRLQKALHDMDEATVRQALADGADPNAPDEEGRAPLVALWFVPRPTWTEDDKSELTETGFYPREEAIETVLLDAGADPRVRWREPDGPWFDLFFDRFTTELSVAQQDDEDIPEYDLEARLTHARRWLDAGASVWAHVGSVHLPEDADHPVLTHPDPAIAGDEQGVPVGQERKEAIQRGQTLVGAMNWAAYNDDGDGKESPYLPVFLSAWVSLLVEYGLPSSAFDEHLDLEDELAHPPILRGPCLPLDQAIAQGLNRRHALACAKALTSTLEQPVNLFSSMKHSRPRL